MHASADISLKKEDAVRFQLAGMSSAMVAFSAGVDSTYLLDVAVEVLGDRVIAVTADSPSLTRASLAEAQLFCRDRTIHHIVVKTDEFEQAEYLANDGKRCYHCKAALMRAMGGLIQATASDRGRTALLIGAIADDLNDYRPGMRAAAEAGARWPLADAGFSKDEVRSRSRARHLPTWDRPAEPCLSSRVPYGEPVSIASLRMIEAAEIVLKKNGFGECRARHHRIGADNTGTINHAIQSGEMLNKYLCRIEVPESALERIVMIRHTVVTELKRIGYAQVTLDLAGLASGGFNALLQTPPTTTQPA